MAYYDDEGNEVEGVLPAEEAAKLQEQVKLLEEKAKQAEELDAKLKEKETELQKLSNKDYNFQKLRDKTEAEIEEFKSKMSEKDKLVLNEVMDLRREKEELERRVEDRTKADVYRSLGVEDEASKKAIELALKEIGGLGNAKTPEEVEAKYRTAYIVAKGAVPARNPLFSGYSASYREPDTTPKKFDETDQGKESIRKWFPEQFPRIFNDNSKN